MELHWSVAKELLWKAQELVPVGGTILELGSGYSTQYFVEQGYTTYSIEHNEIWLNKVPGANYIYAPIEDWGDGNHCPLGYLKHFPLATGWYAPWVVGSKLPPKYDLILVDGPGRDVGRCGFLAHLGMFNTDVPILVDDMNRNDDLMLARMVAERVGRDLLITNNGKGKKAFGIIK